MAAAVTSNRGGEIRQDIETLQVAGFSDGQEAGSGQLALGTAVSKADLRHWTPVRSARSALLFVVSTPSVVQEDEQSVIVLEQSRGEIADLTVRAVQVLLRQSEDAFLNRD